MSEKKEESKKKESEESEESEETSELEETEDSEGTGTADSEKSEKSKKSEKSILKKDTHVKLSLQLSDIVRFESPTNEILNNQSFIINYIDSSKIKLINITDFTSIQLKIHEDGTIGDNSVISIALLDREKDAGYAKQNKLNPNTWINIHFGGETPVIITGLITNLEEDMIEIKTYPDNDILYINFEYKGIPEDLPIESIEIREKPEKKQKKDESVEESDEKSVEEESERTSDLPELSKEEKEIYIIPPVTNVRDTINEFIIRADEIRIGKEFASVTQLVEVEESKQRYNINSQTEDLLNELLSSIPSIKRTDEVLNNIHVMIERFKQLRVDYSDLDEHGNVISMIIKSADWKPLIHNLRSIKTALYWLLPVAKNVKKLYDISSTEEIEGQDIDPLNIGDELGEMKTIMDRYWGNDVAVEQNKYVQLISDLEPYLNPFKELGPELKDEIINDVRIETDLNVVIDNLGDFYSSVVEKDSINTKRFVFEKYNTGPTRLEATQFSGSKMISTRVPIVSPDILSLKSFIIMPEPVIRFSRINLPGTNILDKANLNTTFIYYWKLLNSHTNIQNVVIDDLNADLEINISDKITNYSFANNDKIDPALTDYQIYKKFLKCIIPKTRLLFQIMKKYIHGKLSLYDVVGFLEPFLIYTNDLTFLQYTEINKFLQEQISNYNKKFKQREKNMSLFKTKLENSNPVNSQILESLVTDKKILGSLYENNDIKQSESELLRKIKMIDYANIYDSAIALENVITMLPEHIGSIIDNLERDIHKTKEEIQEEDKKNKCNNIVISKQYKTMEDVSADNDKITYFDKKYDDTQYGVLEMYQKEQITKTPEEFYEFFVNKLITKQGIPPQNGPYMAETIINGVKRVIDGDYAILYSLPDDKMQYFVRHHNRWKIDPSINESMVLDDKSLLCNFQQDCIEVDKKYNAVCESHDLNKKHITENILKEIITNFDEKYNLSKEELKEILSKKFEYNCSIITKLYEISHQYIYKYNDQQFKIGISSDDLGAEKSVMSPYIKLRDIILGESNISKKQQDIVRFAIRFTRDASPDIYNEGDFEDIHWRYCIQTNTKLLPSFLHRLASSFTEDNENYSRTMDQIIKEIGSLSDDGDSWVDKHSGYIIKPIDFDMDEGYEEGFRVRTREILEQDAGDVLVSNITSKIKKQKYSSHETQMMSNIINALSNFMGIDLEDQKEFMIATASYVLEEGALPSEKDHLKQVEEAAKKGKNLPTYTAVYNSTILYLTLGIFLIGIQISIPSIKTRKTFPGCVQSFTGYPFEGNGDTSSLNYLACVAYKIKSSTAPWSALMKIKEKSISDKIKAFIDTYYLENLEIKRKIKEKLEYLILNPVENIPKEHDLSKWNTFLPPLTKIEINYKLLTNVSEEFKHQCLRDFKTGAACQRDKILVLQSKIIFFSFAIQECIQHVVNKKQLILTNAANEPFLENACCNETTQTSTIKYFINEENDISKYAVFVLELSNILDDITSVTLAPTFYCNINSKNIYSLLDNNNYNEETIYKAFIHFCKFNTNIPISEDLSAICGEKPEHYLSYDTITDKIQKLKQDGKHYKNDSLLRLIQYISRKNLITVKTEFEELSPVQLLRNSLDRKKEDAIIPKLLKDGLINCLDTFELSVTDDTEEMKTLKNYLLKVNPEIKNEIKSFLKDNGNVNKRGLADITAFLNTFIRWSTEPILISDDCTYNSFNFIKEYMRNFMHVFPRIIQNKVDYTSQPIPEYWGLSEIHKIDVKKIMNNYYSELRVFYDDKRLSSILNRIQLFGKELLKVVDATPYYSEINYKDTTSFAVLDKEISALLMENYFLQMLLEFKKLSDDKKMLVREVVFEDEDELGVMDEDVEDIMFSRLSHPVLLGNMTEMKKRTAALLITFINIMMSHKDMVDTDYEKIMDTLFKTKEREKDTFTDRLNALTDEERNADTILKINKLGVWNKGLQKGLTSYVKDTYDNEREQGEMLIGIEKSARNQANATDNNIDQLMEDALEEREIADDIDAEDNDLTHFLGDDADGDYQGGEEDDWQQYN